MTISRGRPPSPEQEESVKATANYWRKVSNEAPVQAVKRIEDAAKQIIGLTGTVQSLYFGVIAFSSLRQYLKDWESLLFLLPMLFWLLSMFCATQVFVPRVRNADLNDVRIDAWQNLREEYHRVVKDKLTWLHRAHLLLVISFVAVLLLLGALAFLPPASASEPARSIILTPTPHAAPMPTP